jgi:putative membrane protein
MVQIIAKLLITVLAILFVANFIPGIEVAGLYTALLIALVLGLINLTIKPILFVLTLPITLLSLGLFTFVLNGLLFWFVASFVEGFEVTGFLPAFVGALVVSLFSWVGNRLF